MKILVLSDIHSGSRYALSPPNFEGYSGNKIQKTIFKKWREMCATVKKPDILVLNGDITDGKGLASEGKEEWTTDIQMQIDAAERLIGMIDYGKAFLAYGSRYHTDENINADEAFAKQIGVKAHGWEINLAPEGTKSTMHFSHQISVSNSAWQYPTTPLAKELVAALLNEHCLPKYDIIGRAHAHYYCHVAFSHSFAFINPCWQVRTPYMIRKGLTLIPKMGYTVLSNDDETWDLLPETFDIPTPETVS